MGSLRLTVIGSDGSWPGPGGACSSYLVRTQETSVLVDMGTGALAALQLHASPWSIDAIIITHEHMDHCADLHALDVMANLAGRQLPPVYASHGVREQIFARSGPRMITQWNELVDGQDLVIGDLTIRTSQTDHPVTTHALRIQHETKSLLYTADTGVNWSATPLGDEVDVVLCEAADRAHVEQDWHLNSLQAARLARSAKAGRLLLTHIRPGVDRDGVVAEAKQQFLGDVQVARPGMTIEI